MKWKELSVGTAKKCVEAMKKGEEIETPAMEPSYVRLGEALNNAWLAVKEELIATDNKKLSEYRRDLGFALRLYELFSSGEFFMPVSTAANPGVWRYIEVYLTPDIVKERYPRESSWNDHFYQKPNRIYLKTLWWYIYLSWQGSLADTRMVIEGNNTDTIVQLVERSGAHGYRVELYRQIMRRFFLFDDSKQDMKLFRRVMKLNTARIVSVEPEMMEKGIPGYVEELYNYFIDEK